MSHIKECHNDMISESSSRVRNRLTELSLASLVVLEAAMSTVLGGRLHMVVIEFTRVEGGE